MVSAPLKADVNVLWVNGGTGLIRPWRLPRTTTSAQHPPQLVVSLTAKLQLQIRPPSREAATHICPGTVCWLAAEGQTLVKGPQRRQQGRFWSRFQLEVGHWRPRCYIVSLSTWSVLLRSGAGLEAGFSPSPVMGKRGRWRVVLMWPNQFSQLILSAFNWAIQPSLPDRATVTPAEDTGGGGGGGTVSSATRLFHLFRQLQGDQQQNRAFRRALGG